MKNFASGCLSQITRRGSLDFFIDLLVPINQVELIPEDDKSEVLRFYLNKFKKKSKEEVILMFKNLILKGENYEKYFNNLNSTKYFPDILPGGNYLLVKSLIRDIKRFYNEKNHISTRYESIKANNYYEVYKKKFQELNSTKMFKK